MLIRVSQEVYVEAKRLFRNGADNETVMAFLKKNGGGPIDAIAMLREVHSIPLIEAKRLVHDSEAFADGRIDWEEELKKAESELEDKL